MARNISPDEIKALIKENLDFSKKIKIICMKIQSFQARNLKPVNFS
ncbi:hypothetical protein [Anaerococcus hydrogenalis]|nr:hypothetical protein [Anaerococcus hydrogenalis]